MEGPVSPYGLEQAFAVWAAVVGLVGAAIVYELARLRGELKTMREQIYTYTVGMERRVSSMETHLRLRDGFRAHRRVGDDDDDEAYGA